MWGWYDTGRNGWEKEWGFRCRGASELRSRPAAVCLETPGRRLNCFVRMVLFLLHRGRGIIAGEGGEMGRSESECWSDGGCVVSGTWAGFKLGFWWVSMRCCEGVEGDSVLCVECLGLVHGGCSGVSGELKSDAEFHCMRCLEGNHRMAQWLVRLSWCRCRCVLSRSVPYRV